MSGLNGIPIQRMRYDAAEYDLRTPVEEILDCRDLEKLHLQLGQVSLMSRETDQSTTAHRRFYAQMQEKFVPPYRRFVQDMIRPLFKEPIVYQAAPTFRVHLPENLAVGEWHRDTDYNHNPEAVTFWVPLTNAYDTNSVYIMTPAGPRSMTVPYGEVLIFDSMNLKHGNMVNATPDTRVSIDFRVISESEFTPSDATTMNTGMKMDIGGYYERA